MSTWGWRGRAGTGWGQCPRGPLTVSAVLELRLPQERQADEDGLANVALLRQRRVADGTAAAPRLQEPLQCLAGGAARLHSRSDLPTTARERTGLGAPVLASVLCSRRERSPSPTRRWSQNTPDRGPHRAYLYEERAPLAVCGQVPQQALQHGRLGQKPGILSLSVGRRQLPRLPEHKRLWAEGQGVSRTTELSCTCYGHFPWAPRVALGPRPHRVLVL